MNERIRELAKQAEGTKKHVPAVWQFYDHELEKFAELLVLECAPFVGDLTSPAVKEFLHHFGVNNEQPN